MEEISEEELRSVKACLYFATVFSDYVKENDLELWNRARQFAIDFTNIEGVTFVDAKNK